MSQFAESASWPAKAFRATLAVVLGVALMVPGLAPAQANAAGEAYSHGNISIASDDAHDNVIELGVGETATVTVTPYQHVQYEGCGMPGCPEICGGESCFTPGKGCVCVGNVPALRSSDVSVEIEDDSVVTAGDVEADEELSESADAIGQTNAGSITLTAEEPGETSVVVKATGLTQWADAEQAYTVKVAGAEEGTAADREQGEPVENTDARVSAYRDAQYGEPPSGEASTDGQHVRIVISFDGPVEVTDQSALLDSLEYTISGGYTIESASAQGNDLVLVATGAMLPGGQTAISAKAEDGVIAGVTVDGKPAKLKPIYTIADTGLAFEVVEAVAGTDSAPASTTFKVTHSANVRSMNNIVWLTNGGQGDTGSAILNDGQQWTPAHHHEFWRFDLDTSAQFIADGANSALAEAGYTVTASGSDGEFTITADTPKAGEVLSAAVYSDTFFHETGLARDQAVTGIEMPHVSDLSDAAKSVDATARAYRDPAYAGQASTEGCYLEIDVEFPGAVDVTDEKALLASLDYTISGGVELTSAKADGNTLVLSGAVSMFPGGDIDVRAAASSGLLEGITVDGARALLEPIQTVGDTGLSIEVVSAVAGTDTTPAATTFRIVGQAQVRSMNNIVWLTNGGAGDTGSSIIANEGARTQATPAHHHMFWSMDKDDSAAAVVDNAAAKLSALGYTVTAGPDGTFNITADAPKAGEVLSAAVYDDTFLHANGLVYGADIENVALPTDKLVADPAQYQISYVLNGGTNAADNPAAHVAGTTVTLQDPTREGYTFEGWFTDSGFVEDTRVSQISFADTGDVTVYAKWKTDEEQATPTDPKTDPGDSKTGPVDDGDEGGAVVDEGAGADTPVTGDVLPFAPLVGIVGAAIAVALAAAFRRRGMHGKN